MGDELKHFGVKGMKWGVRKKKDSINSKDRVIKKGTEIQNISSRKFEKQDRHMYGSYTKFDNDSYVDLMGNYMYGEKAYRNTFKVQKDIKIPSDKVLVESFMKLAKENPKQIADDMSKAYNDTRLFMTKSANKFEKKINKVDDITSKKGEKLTKEYISLMVSDKAAKSRAEFFGSLMKKGYDGMSDVNDREGGAKDPLIIFSPKKSLSDPNSIKLTEKELRKYLDMNLFDRKHLKSGDNVDDIQQSALVGEEYLKHHGVKGMKWGVRRKENKSNRRQKVESKLESVEKRRLDKVSKSPRKTKIENQLERIHSKRMNNKKYSRDYNFYREIGHTHANARKYASREVTNRYMQLGVKVIGVYDSVRMVNGR